MSGQSQKLICNEKTVPAYQLGTSKTPKVSSGCEWIRENVSGHHLKNLLCRQTRSNANKGIFHTLYVTAGKG